MYKKFTEKYGSYSKKAARFFLAHGIVEKVAGSVTAGHLFGVSHAKIDQFYRRVILPGDV